MTPTIANAGANAAAGGTTAAAAAKGGALSSLSNNFSNFLSLLMTQLKNQDPTSPLDTNQFTSQLVQFTSVEQQINTNASLTKLIELTQGGEMLQSSALVGKSVQVTSDQIVLQDGRGAVQFAATGSQPVNIGIYSESGVKLRDEVVASQPGRNEWSWDGKDAQGAAVPDGAYRIFMTTQPGAGGAAQEVPFTVGGIATGVQKGGKGLQVQMGVLEVDLSAVKSVSP